MNQDYLIALTLSFASSVGFTAAMTSQATVPFIGVPLVVPIMCLIAAVVAMGLNDPVTPRGKMYFLLASTILLGTLSVNFWPHVPGFGWTSKVPGVAIGPVTTFLLQWWLLPAIEAGKRSINGYKSKP